MHRAMWIYVPTVALLIAAAALPHVGPSFIGGMNLRELALFLAFWWLVLALAWRLVRDVWAESRRDAAQPRGFDVTPSADDSADRQ